MKLSLGVVLKESMCEEKEEEARGWRGNCYGLGLVFTFLHSFGLLLSEWDFPCLLAAKSILGHFFYLRGPMQVHIVHVRC